MQKALMVYKSLSDENVKFHSYSIPKQLWNYARELKTHMPFHQLMVSGTATTHAMNFVLPKP